MSQSFDDFDPAPYGMDGAIEFPPHKLTKDLNLANADINYLDDTFTGQVFRYDDVVAKSLDEPRPSFPLIKTVVPSWDNDARRQGNGLVLQGSTPAKYESWLSTLVEEARQHPAFGEPLVCVNAWNEWCEGAYLEPDLHFGAAYLNATSRAVTGLSRLSRRPRLLLIGHDAFPSGAQLLLLNLGKTFRHAFGLQVEYILLDGGQLESEYAAVAKVTICQDGGLLEAALREQRERGSTTAIVNTSAAGHAASIAANLGYDVVFLVHELPHILSEKGLEPAARAGLESAKHVVFPANYVRDRITRSLGVRAEDRFLIRPQGSYKQIVFTADEVAAVRLELGMRPGDRLVLGVGYADMRKGFDLFIQLWRTLRQTQARIHFCWVGAIDPSMRRWLESEIAHAEAMGTFHVTGFREAIGPFYAAADAFALTSREDPFPSVALEALSLGVPVFAFENSGGIPDFLREHAIGHVAPYCDAPAMAQLIGAVLTTGSNEVAQKGAVEVIARHLSFRAYARDLLRLAMPDASSVSVIVPNYNYAECLTERLATIFNQTHLVEEIIVLDDASSDDSVGVINALAEQHERDLTLIINERNSGSVFSQWLKGAQEAAGEFVWIAEADDLSEPSFLLNLLTVMKTNPAIQIGFCDSKSIDAHGAPVYPSYKGYYATAEAGALTHSEIFHGRDFARRFLSVKNLILNVSAVIWRREALLKALALCQTDLARLRMAGDWRLYLECLIDPDALLAYVAEPLNIHRRHAQSVTHSLKGSQHVNEIAEMHTAIRERLDVADAIKTAQSIYIKEVRAQLCASEPEDFEKMPPLARISG